MTLYFWDCFFFSVQTMETIGYGGLYPASPYSNVIVCVQSYWGFLQTAIIMGFVFAKISRPSRIKRHILFSEVAVVNKTSRYYQGSPDSLSTGSYVNERAPCLVFRVANLKQGQLCDTQFRLLLLRRETIDGKPCGPDVAHRSVFRLHELNFEINEQVGRVRGIDLSTPLLPLPWTIIHAMDENSPLYGATLSDLEYWVII